VKTIAHISDLHFGTEDSAVTEALARELDGSTHPLPSVIAISGDLTQRARPHQFRAARAFLDGLKAPYVVVPGNHDVPLYNLYERFVHPLRRYRELITDDLSPLYADAELVVVGVTTAHGFTAKDGKITRADIDRACAQLADHRGKWKIVVAHHPFLIPEGGDRDDLVDNAQEALDAFRAAGVDMILGGHLHVAYSDDVAFRDRSRRIIAVAAGTAISKRLRGQPNGYNTIAFDHEDIAVTHRVWDGTAFVDGDVKRYHHAGMRFDKLPAFSAMPSEIFVR
jgi:3',5'-cyclic AMP phosphodiesterase CpdA